MWKTEELKNQMALAGSTNLSYKLLAGADCWLRAADTVIVGTTILIMMQMVVDWPQFIAISDYCGTYYLTLMQMNMLTC